MTDPWIEERLISVSRFLEQRQLKGWALEYWTKVRDDLMSKYIQGQTRH